MEPLDSQDIKQILVRSANWVGDAIMSTPALHAVRTHFPKARITLLAKPWVVPVFDHNADIDDMLVYEAAGRHRGRTGLWRLASDMRRKKFDLAVLFQNAFEAALLAFLAGIPRRLGYTTDARGLLLTHRIRTWRGLKKGHLIDYYLGLLEGAGVKTMGRQLHLVLSAEEKEQAGRTIAEAGLAGKKWVAGINPGATFGTAKRWPAERFAKLAARLIHESNAGVLIFGAAAEEALGRQIAADAGPGCTNLCGSTTLRQAMALIAACDLFVTNDSGLMHVAAAFDIPQVVIIGPTDHATTGPSNANSRILRESQSCPLMPCMKPHCPEDHRCMTAVSVEQVLEAGIALLEKPRAA